MKTKSEGLVEIFMSKVLNLITYRKDFLLHFSRKFKEFFLFMANFDFMVYQIERGLILTTQINYLQRWINLMNSQLWQLLIFKQ